MSDGEDLEDRTEEATQHRRDEWRREGRVVQSKELKSALLAFGFIGIFWGFSPWMFAGISSLFEKSYSGLDVFAKGDWTIATVMSMGSFSLQALLFICGPLAVAIVSIGILSSLVQFGFIWSTKPMEPNLNKLNPISGFKKIFGMEGFFEAFKALFKFILVAAVSIVVFNSGLTRIGSYSGGEPQSVVSGLGYEVIRIMAVITVVMLVIASIDYIFQKFRYEQKIKMTKEEAKQERKQQDGNPQIKAKVRAIQRSVATRRMMDAVKKADVVITNPTHFAVALLYDKENMQAPKIIAKGVDHMALRIKEIAREAGVPVVENPPLARALYKALKVGQLISRELYNAVAEVLAYVYRLKGKANL